MYEQAKASRGVGVSNWKRVVQVATPKARRLVAPLAVDDWLARFQLPVQRPDQRLARCHIL